MVTRPADALDAGNGDALLVRLRGLLPELSGALRQVAEAVLADPSRAARATIVELGELSGTSPATVTRFCRTLGFEGYPELRLSIATALGRAVQAGWEVDIGHEILPGDPMDRVLNILLSADSRAIQETAAQLDLAAVGHVVEAMAAATRVDIFATGGSATVAEEMHLRLYRIGVRTWWWSDVHNGLTSAALLKPGDVALAISHSGRVKETLEMLGEARRRGATTVALTNFARSPIADIADHVLTTAVRETSFRPDALSARHSQLLVLDLIYVAVAQRIHDRAASAFVTTSDALSGHRISDPAPPRRRGTDSP